MMVELEEKTAAASDRTGSSGVSRTSSQLAARFITEGVEGGVVETLQAHLFEFGALGTWEHGANDFEVKDRAPAGLDAYFSDAQWSQELAARCIELGGMLGCAFEGFELIIDQDWMAAHRNLAQPIIVGKFVVDPREPDDSVSANDPDLDCGQGEAAPVVICVPARRAFGTGSHETTRLVLRLLQQADLVDKRVLDVGCGTGVLSFAAHHLGAIETVGFDVDPVSAVLAVENRQLNALPKSIRFFAGAAEALSGPRSGRFDVALVNVLPEKISGQEAIIGSAMAASGEIVVSGLLDGHASAATAQKRWQQCGWGEVDRLVEGEWLAVRLRSGDRLLADKQARGATAKAPSA